MGIHSGGAAHEPEASEFSQVGKGLVCLQEGVKKPFYRWVSMDILSWVILIRLRNLFVPVLTGGLDKSPHIL